MSNAPEPKPSLTGSELVVGVAQLLAAMGVIGLLGAALVLGIQDAWKKAQPKTVHTTITVCETERGEVERRLIASDGTTYTFHRRPSEHPTAIIRQFETVQREINKRGPVTYDITAEERDGIQQITEFTEATAQTPEQCS